MKFSRTDIRSGVVACTCSVIYGLLVSVARQSSLLFIASITRFNIDRESASFPFVLLYATRNAFGPLIGFIGTKFGVKTAILCGSCMSSIALFLCFFAENITTITILWGLVYGFTFGLGCGLVPQVMQTHFSSHMDKAIGLTLADHTCMFVVENP
ncbi:uncharacterized protein NPIL_259991 [Nephila pilipes]|uniref:Uncharacterized protein n=1 Tax=Nephila pilipes TaxID=299642 RepID=A0A8X6K4E2_NEPPI|nr:uncharacterized protein NPIL_259991 [Nephila pilipes]